MATTAGSPGSGRCRGERAPGHGEIVHPGIHRQHWYASSPAAVAGVASGRAAFSPTSGGAASRRGHLNDHLVAGRARPAQHPLPPRSRPARRPRSRPAAPGWRRRRSGPGDSGVCSRPGMKVCCTRGSRRRRPPGSRTAPAAHPCPGWTPTIPSPAFRAIVRPASTARRRPPVGLGSSLRRPGRRRARSPAGRSVPATPRSAAQPAHGSAPPGPQLPQLRPQPQPPHVRANHPQPSDEHQAVQCKNSHIHDTRVMLTVTEIAPLGEALAMPGGISQRWPRPRGDRVGAPLGGDANESRG